MKKAFITGINGQCGSWLAEYLVSLGYEVHGLIRRKSQYSSETSHIQKLVDDGKIFVHYGDLLDYTSLHSIFSEVKPDEVYNLAAQSHVRVSFDVPRFTMEVNAVGLLNVLDCVRLVCPEAKVYQASTSEMFGNVIDDDGLQRETTAMKPVSPYGCSKLAAHCICANYRNAYGLFISCGILFNNESSRRGENFVTAKIAKAAAAISLGLQDSLELGNLDAYRDWGHSKDYVRAMHAMLQHHEPDDFVISSMETHSVRDFCEAAFNRVGLDYKNYVKTNPKFLRPEELKRLKGDSSKARQALNWEPEYDFRALVEDMVDYWLTLLQKSDSL